MATLSLLQAGAEILLTSERNGEEKIAVLVTAAIIIEPCKDANPSQLGLSSSQYDAEADTFSEVITSSLSSVSQVAFSGHPSFQGPKSVGSFDQPVTNFT